VQPSRAFLDAPARLSQGEVLVRWLVETKSLVYEMLCKTKKRVSLERGKTVLIIDESLTEDVDVASA
jgi:hypothetical protein